MQMFDELLEKEEQATSGGPPTFLDKFFDGK